MSFKDKVLQAYPTAKIVEFSTVEFCFRYRIQIEENWWIGFGQTIGMAWQDAWRVTQEQMLQKFEQ